MQKTDDGNLEASTGDVDSSSSQTSEDKGQQLPEYVKGILDRLAAQEKRLQGLQKGTDKQIGQVKTEISRILALKEKGMDAEQIEREMLLDQLLNSGQAGITPDKVSHAVPNAYSVADAFTALEKYSLPANDPAFLALLRNPQLSEGMVKDYILAKFTPRQTPSPADVVLSPVKAPASGEKTPAQLEADYQKEMQTIMQTLSPAERIRAISTLKEKYTRLGLPKA